MSGVSLSWPLALYIKCLTLKRVPEISPQVSGVHTHAADNLLTEPPSPGGSFNGKVSFSLCYPISGGLMMKLGSVIEKLRTHYSSNGVREDTVSEQLFC